jgi:uncharacterized RDD family membrane protein YckC
MSLPTPDLRLPSTELRAPSTPVGTALAVSFFMGNLLWLIIVILVVMWLGGFAFHVGGGLIHLLLVIAVIVLVIQLLTGRRSV